MVGASPKSTCLKTKQTGAIAVCAGLIKTYFSTKVD